MDSPQRTLDHALKELPHRFFEGMVSKKLRALGIEATPALSRELAAHILTGNGGPFRYRSSKPHGTVVTLVFDDADGNELTKALDSFCETRLPQLVDSLASSTSKQLVKRLRSDWVNEHLLQQTEAFEFRGFLEDRWGIPLAQLRMMLTIAREWCPELNNKPRDFEKDNKSKLHNVLIRLLIRACQVTNEIICLLENGFADGAMARWRSLHEIGVVASVISLHGEDIAERYIAHAAVESRRAMDRFTECRERLGHKPISKRARRKIMKAYQAVIDRYGEVFKGNYGWAAEHLRKKSPTFAELEVEAGREEMRAHYQMGNDNVHAGVKSIFHRLGVLENYVHLLPGRSNAGLAEPGLNTALTLMRLSVLVCMSNDLDDLAIAQVMISLSDETQRSFCLADKKLRRDDKIQRATAQSPHPSETA